MAQSYSHISDKQIEINHSNFIKELEKLSKKYGVVVQVVGGVWHDEPTNLAPLTYSDDHTSGDILPQGL